MKSKKSAIYICFAISIVCIFCAIFFTLDKKWDKNICLIIVNISYALLGSAVITLILSIKEYKNGIDDAIDKLFLLLLKMDNELGKQKYYVYKISLEKLVTAIASCVDYLLEIRMIIVELLDGLFCFNKHKKSELNSLGVEIEDVMATIYALGNILENEKEYAKKHIEDLYRRLTSKIYDKDFISHLERMIKSYNNKYGLNWLSEDKIVISEIQNIKDEFKNIED
ncbi:MAG: hypothetical protein NC310_07085 [Roseburia sp.]|nr:hypothetical protein [Anaeroplasma bactoclasticum]MCM1196812.1 hypothetical protein [Roseburia sp.]MCM1556948.1 hypothetical protein [Anaeroplasma bactoclasticum]